MPRFLAPITVGRETVTGSETISGNQIILSGTFGKDSYWTSVSASGGLSADHASFTNNVSAFAFYGDGSHLTGLEVGVLSTGNLSSYYFSGNGNTVLFDLSSTKPQTNPAGYQVILNGATQTPNKDYVIVYSNGTNKLSTLFVPVLGCELYVSYLGSHITSTVISAVNAEIKSVINYVIDGAESAITLGSKGFIQIPSNFHVNEWSILADKTTTSFSVDVRKAKFEDLPTTVSIVSGDPITLTNQRKNNNLYATWTNISAGEYLEFYVTQVSEATLVYISLNGIRS